MSEKEFQDKMIKFLKHYFYVFSEVWSTDSQCRIDLVIIHFSDKERKYPIGIEIKIDDIKRGKNLALWIKQGERYSKKDFKGFGKMPVIACPQISGLYFKEGEYMHQHFKEGSYSADNNVGTFLGQFGMGEFQKYYWSFDVTKYRIVFKGKILWDMKDNILRMHNYDKLCR